MSKQGKNLGRNVLIAMFCLYIGAMAALYVLLPKTDFSENEKRVLAKMPTLTAASALDGSFESGFERWMSDHVPMRDALVGLHAIYEQVSGRNGLSGVILTRDERLIAAPAAMDEADLLKKCKKINGLASATGLPVAVLLIPENGCAHRDLLPALHDPYRDVEAAEITAGALEGVDFIWPLEQFSDASAGEYYYRTDHHYTSLGAYEACRLYVEELGMSLPPKDAYDVQTVTGFHGSMYAKSGLWAVPPETLELWRSPRLEHVRVSFDDREDADTLFFEEHLATMDKYSAYLDGNHALVTIDTGLPGERLLIVRDSFGHCFAPFASECFSRIVLADLRYYHKPLSELARQENIDRVLVLYGMDSFMTDSNFGWIK